MKSSQYQNEADSVIRATLRDIELIESECQEHGKLLMVYTRSDNTNVWTYDDGYKKEIPV